MDTSHLFSAMFAELLENVGDKFPHSVAGDSVLTNMAWELAAAWHKNPDDVTQLSHAVAHIAEIKNSHIRHGKNCDSFFLKLSVLPTSLTRKDFTFVNSL